MSKLLSKHNGIIFKWPVGEYLFNDWWPVGMLNSVENSIYRGIWSDKMASVDICVCTYLPIYRVGIKTLST